MSLSRRCQERAPAEAADEVLNRLTEVGLIDDQRFADAWFEGQQRRQRSTRVLRQELRIKGVDAELVDQAASSAPDDADLIDRPGARRQTVAGHAAIAAQHQAAAGSPGELSRRGFGSAVISTVLK